MWILCNRTQNTGGMGESCEFADIPGYIAKALKDRDIVTADNIKKLQFITLLTAICIVSHIENSKNDKGYIT